jgi:hypothetical protein
MPMAARKTPSGGKKPDKLCRDALSLELAQEVKYRDPKTGQQRAERKMRLVQRALVNAAINGEVAAIKVINDRMDGKVPSPITGTGKDGAIPLDIKNLNTEQLEELLARINRYLDSEES